MFFKLILENANGDRVDMTATANQYMTVWIGYNKLDRKHLAMI